MQVESFDGGFLAHSWICFAAALMSSLVTFSSFLQSFRSSTARPIAEQIQVSTCRLGIRKISGSSGRVASRSSKCRLRSSTEDPSSASATTIRSVRALALRFRQARSSPGKRLRTVLIFPPVDDPACDVFPHRRIFGLRSAEVAIFADQPRVAVVLAKQDGLGHPFAHVSQPRAIRSAAGSPVSAGSANFSTLTWRPSGRSSLIPSRNAM